MTNQEIDDLVVSQIKRYGDITFPKLMEFVDNATDIDPYGELSMWLDGDGTVLPNDMNLLLWNGMSKEFINLWDRLYVSRNKGRIELYEMGELETFLVHGFDGSPMLKLPIAKRVPKRGYKKPRWLPCIIKPFPPRDPRKIRSHPRDSRGFLTSRPSVAENLKIQEPTVRDIP
jgi:hypothetical protein